MFDGKVRQIIQEKYIELVGIVIDQTKTMSMQDIETEIDTAFSNVWEAFVNEMQIEESGLYYSLCDTVRQISEHVVQRLTITEVKMLWLISDACLDWDENDDFPSDDKMLSDIAEELFSWVEQEAEQPEFEDEEYEAEEEYLSIRH